MTSPGSLLDGAPDTVEEPRRLRTPVLLGAGAALAGLALGGVLLLGGSPDEVVDAAAAPGVAPPTAAAATPTPTAAPSAPADDATGGRAVRDPFAPLDGEAPAAAPPAVPGEVPGAAEGGAPGAVPVTLPGTGGGPDTGPGPDPAPPAGAPEPPADVAAGVRLALLRVEGPPEARRAVLSVDGVAVTAGVGDAVGASDLLLLSVQEGPEDGQWTAVVQLGTGEPFDVVSGAPVVAR